MHSRVSLVRLRDTYIVSPRRLRHLPSRGAPRARTRRRGETPTMVSMTFSTEGDEAREKNAHTGQESSDRWNGRVQHLFQEARRGVVDQKDQVVTGSWTLVGVQVRHATPSGPETHPDQLDVAESGETRRPVATINLQGSR